MILRIFVIMLLSFSIVEAKSLVMTVFKSNDFVMKEQLHLQNHLSMIVSKILGSEWKLITGENIGVELEKKKNLEIEDCVGDCSLSMKRVLGADWIFICRVMDMDKFMSVSIELYDKEDNLVEVVNRDLIKSMSDILKVKRSMSFIVDKFRKYFPRKESYGVGASSIDKRDDYSFGNVDSIRKSSGVYNKVIDTRSSASKLLSGLSSRRAKLPVRPSRRNIKSVMRRVRIRSCVGRDPYRVVSSRLLRVRLYAVSSGRITSAEVLNRGRYGNIIASCIERSIRGLRFESFRNESVSFVFPFKI